MATIKTKPVHFHPPEDQKHPGRGMWVSTVITDNGSWNVVDELYFNSEVEAQKNQSEREVALKTKWHKQNQ